MQRSTAFKLKIALSHQNKNISDMEMGRELKIKELVFNR